MPGAVAAKVLASASGTKVEPIILLLGFGMRREEVAGLRWENIDLEKGLIYIREVRTEVNGVEEIKRPKTESSVRTIAIPECYLSVFTNIKKRQRKHNQSIRNMNHLYVIGKADGTPYSPNYELAAPVREYPQQLTNVEVDDKDATLHDPAVVAAEQAVTERLGDEGRILVRKSGTEPVLRVMVEAATHALCEENVAYVIDVMQKSGHLIRVR